jgi:hypothetical protein
MICYKDEDGCLLNAAVCSLVDIYVSKELTKPITA